MKKIISFMVVMIPMTSVWAAGSAADRGVKVESFHLVDTASRTAELCGSLIGEKSALDIVDVVVDPNTSAEGDYTTLVSAGGHFCLLLVTHTGRAELRLRGEAKSFKAARL
jgi:hypothetical protein